MGFRFYAPRAIPTHAPMNFFSSKIEETYTFMTISQAEISRDIEISRRKKEMSQNVLWEGNVALEYGDES